MPAKKCPQCGFKLPTIERKPNAYNEFVRTAMKRPDIQKIRMRAVAVLWDIHKKKGSATDES